MIYESIFLTTHFLVEDSCHHRLVRPELLTLIQLYVIDLLIGVAQYERNCCACSTEFEHYMLFVCGMGHDHGWTLHIT